MLLTWQPPQFELQNGLIRQYHIAVTHNRTGLMYTVISNTTEYLLQNLFPFHTYIFTVAAETVGIGPYSPELAVTLLEDGKLSFPYCTLHILPIEPTDVDVHRYGLYNCNIKLHLVITVLSQLLMLHLKVLVFMQSIPQVSSWHGSHPQKTYTMV